MTYWVLVEDSNLRVLVELTKWLSWVDQVLGSTTDAVKWLIANPEATLIVRMPLDEEQRREIAGKLDAHAGSIIALDPARLLSGSSKLFTNTFPWEVAIVAQIKGIIEAQTVYS